MTYLRGPLMGHFLPPWFLAAASSEVEERSNLFEAESNYAASGTASPPLGVHRAQYRNTSFKKLICFCL